MKTKGNLPHDNNNQLNMNRNMNNSYVQMGVNNVNNINNNINTKINNGFRPKQSNGFVNNLTTFS